MNKKQTLLLSIFSALIISGFGFVSVMASSATGTPGVLNKVQEIQKRLGITLTPEQQTQIDAKQKEVETKRADELTKWQSMTLDLWKQQEISKINSTTQEQFDKIKERNINMFKNGRGFMGRLDKGMEEPAD